MAKQITLCDGGLSVWYHPLTPSLQGIVWRQLKSIVGDDMWDSHHGVFAILDTSIVSCELIDENNTEARLICTYFDNRSGDNPMADFVLFSQLITNDSVTILLDGHRDTRAKLPQAPEITQEEKPAPGNPKGKRGKKRTKSTS
jgi:hypothetical protein